MASTSRKHETVPPFIASTRSPDWSTWPAWDPARHELTLSTWRRSGSWAASRATQSSGRPMWVALDSTSGDSSASSVWISGSGAPERRQRRVASTQGAMTSIRRPAANSLRVRSPCQGPGRAGRDGTGQHPPVLLAAAAGLRVGAVQGPDSAVGIREHPGKRGAKVLVQADHLLQGEGGRLRRAPGCGGQPSACLVHCPEPGHLGRGQHEARAVVDDGRLPLEHPKGPGQPHQPDLVAAVDRRARLRRGGCRVHRMPCAFPSKGLTRIVTGRMASLALAGSSEGR